MLRTQRLIVVLGEMSLINNPAIVKEIEGFHACTIIRTLSSAMLENVFHYNKNAIYFANTFNLSWATYKPIVVQLTDSETNVELGLLNIKRIIRDFPKILNTREIDVGDHNSEDSTVLKNQSAHECLFCKILNHATTQREHILYETPSFMVLPGTGAFFPGYLMIVPKKHILSFGQLNKEGMDEFFRVLNDIRSIQEAIYGQKVFCFEAASGCDATGKHKTSIVHAHFHLAPTDMPVLEKVQESGLNPLLIRKEEIPSYKPFSYRLYVDQDDNWFMAGDPNCYYPRQHARQILAQYMGCYDLYNWRVHPMRDKMDVIANEFRTYCSEHLEALPEWVRSSVVFEDR